MDGFSKVWQLVVLIATALLAILSKYVPGIPSEAFLGLLTWVGASMIGQIIGPPGGKPAYQTTEFWLAIGIGALKGAFPDLPEESIYAILTYVGLRPIVKGAAGFSLGAGKVGKPSVSDSQ
ncbi:MAG: hypothetical protein AB1690_10720 [Candidatus Zixiibacteriota bacterium]